jgi:hypothetical protein
MGIANLHIKRAEDWATLVEQEALEQVSRAEAENSVALSSAGANAKDLVRKVILHEDELGEEHRAQETSEREHQKRFKELTLLQTRGSKMCHAIVGPPWARHLSEGMRLAALRNTEMVGELAAFQVTVSSAAKSVLGHSPSNTTHVEVVRELAAKF